MTADQERAAIVREEWRGTKKQRETLRAKFGGRCAYCGGQLGKMHADHLEPVIRVTRDAHSKPLPANECYLVRPERNCVANMMPACAPCNLHKGGYTLEGWRDIIQRSAEISSRATSTFKAGVRFGIIAVSDTPIRFYFERLDHHKDQGHG
jgi:5-methylcytosine-specific restriction endonuclease McrA